MRLSLGRTFVVAAILGLSPAVFAQSPPEKVEQAQAALEKALKQLKDAEITLKKAQYYAKTKGADSKEGPRRRVSGRPSREESKQRMEALQKAMKNRTEKRGPQGGRPSGEDIKKRTEGFQKAMKERMEHHKAAHSKEGARSKGKGPGDQGSRFGRGPHGRPGFGQRGPGGPGRSGFGFGSRRPGFGPKRPDFKPGSPSFKGRPGPGPHERPSADAKSGKRPSIETRLDKLAREIEAIRRELKK